MTLKDDLNNALQALAEEAPNLPVVSLDEQQRCQLAVPIPAELQPLQDQQLVLEIQLAKSGQGFSLSTPVAAIAVEASDDLYKTLLSRQTYFDQMGGLSWAIAPQTDHDLLAITYHWLLENISEQEFHQLYQRFLRAALALIRDGKAMLGSEPDVQLIHDSDSP